MRTAIKNVENDNETGIEVIISIASCDSDVVFYIVGRTDI